MRRLRDHLRHKTRRERDLERILAQTLQSYIDTVALHPCKSCAIDLHVMRAKAEQLGITVQGVMEL